MKERVINLCINNSSILLCHPVTEGILLSWKITQIVSFLLNEVEFSFVICSKCNKCAGRFGLTVSVETGIYIASMLEERGSFAYQISNLQREKTRSGDIYHMPHVCHRTDREYLSLSRTRSLYSSISSKSQGLGNAFNNLLNMPHKEEKIHPSISKYSYHTQRYNSTGNTLPKQFNRTHSQPISSIGFSKIAASSSFNPLTINIANGYQPDITNYPNYDNHLTEDPYNKDSSPQIQSRSTLNSTPISTSTYKCIQNHNSNVSNMHYANSQELIDPTVKDTSSYQTYTLPRSLMRRRCSEGNVLSSNKKVQSDCISIGNDASQWILPRELKMGNREFNQGYGTLPCRRRVASESKTSLYSNSSTFQFPLSSIPVKLKKEPNFTSGGEIIIGETEYKIPRLVPSCDHTTAAHSFSNEYSYGSLRSSDNISHSQASTPCSTSYSVLHNADHEHANKVQITNNHKRQKRKISNNKRYSNSSICSSSSTSSDALLPSLWEDKLTAYQKHALI